MKCAKRDIVRFVPRGSKGNFSINLDELEEEHLAHTIREERGVGRYVPYCNFQAHRGVIVNGLVYLCLGRNCRYFRRYLESGVGVDRVFSTRGSPELVKPYFKEAKRKH